MTPASAPQIYFHVGMGKTASTYLRQSFLPKLKGIYFIPRKDRFDAAEIIARGEYQKYLLCRALDTNMEEGIRDMAMYPETHPIIVLRSPESWLMSQYRRFVKNGFPGSLQDFIDVENNQGFWPREELLFMNKIRLLEQYFRPRPLVLFYDELRKEPQSFFDKIATYTGTTYDFRNIRLAPQHTSHGVGGLILRRRVRRLYSDKMVEYTRIPGLKWIQRRWLMLWAYFIIWLSRFLPKAWQPREPFVDESYLKKVREYAAADWHEVTVYAGKSPVN